MKTPLAWRNLTHDWRRLGLSLAGIAFVVLLMFMEIGFFNGGLDTALTLPKNFNADLIMISSARTPDYPNRFDRGRLAQVHSCPEVATVIPLYIRPATRWKSPDAKQVRTIQVFGFDVRTQPLLASPLEGQRVLRTPGTVLFDTEARDLFGRPTTGTIVELNTRTMEVAGFFTMGVSLDVDGNLLMDESTYFSVLGPQGESAKDVDYGLIQLEPGSDPEAALERIRPGLADDVRIMTRDDFIRSIKEFWEQNTAIAFLFNLGLFVGLIIGVIVCYQILFTDISANLRPFATLKAIGFHNRYVVKVVFQQAAILALLGFGCGLAVTMVLYHFLQTTTGLVMIMTLRRLVGILCLTLFMCMAAALFAVRKAIQTDPADCF